MIDPNGTRSSGVVGCCRREGDVRRSCRGYPVSRCNWHSRLLKFGVHQCFEITLHTCSSVAFIKLFSDEMAQMRVSVSLLIAWLLIAAVLETPIMIVQLPYLQRIERIRENPATTTALFTAKDCANHGSREYVFDVDGKSYDGGGLSEAGGICEAVRIGAPVLIHYEKENPANNTGGNPVAELWNQIIFMLFVALLVPPIFILQFRKWCAQGMPLFRGRI